MIDIEFVFVSIDQLYCDCNSNEMNRLIKLSVIKKILFNLNFRKNNHSLSNFLVREFKTIGEIINLPLFLRKRIMSTATVVPIYHRNWNDYQNGAYHNYHSAEAHLIDSY